jgi:hypothetical protein
VRPDDVLVLDSSFSLALLQEVGVPRFVVRLAKNATLRRTTPPPYRGRGRQLSATAPDEELHWDEGRVRRRAQVWHDLLPATGARPDALPLTVAAAFDSRYRDPGLRATPLRLSPPALRVLCRDRWPVEQVPLVAKQLLGAARRFVSATPTVQRLPILALLAGAILAYATTTAPAIPTGFWDRYPQPTAGRLRRRLAQVPFPVDFPLPARRRAKHAATAQVRTGFRGQRRPRTAPPSGSAA